VPASATSLSLRSERGQAVVEFALVLPILLLLIFGAFDLSRAYGYWNDVNQIAGERARAAATGRIVDAIGNGGLTTVTDDGITVNVSCVITERADPSLFGSPGDAVTVEAEADFEHVGVVSAILGLVGDGQVTGSATMRLERDASDDADVCDA
jgi:Flp pilus assembly protein TadG